ncbi:MAG TPA: hypothetical protein VFS10_12740 [Pyrinomonadaceae bacterium]|nr:hypothetical protein [Pyrinomonadaceae bacterium]
MNEIERQSPRSASEEVPEQSRGAVEEARELLRRGVEEAKRQSAVEGEAARGRGPVSRALLWLTLAACLVAGATLVYGIYYFPDAPLRQTAGGYAGKQGNPRTREDFEAFVRWERTLFIAFPTAFVLAGAHALANGARRRKRKSQGA